MTARRIDPQAQAGRRLPLRHGENGGAAESVKVCHRVGMNYVSCSPYRVPIARLAAAQAAIADKVGKKAKK